MVAVSAAAAFILTGVTAPESRPQGSTVAARALAVPDTRWLHRRATHADLHVLAGSRASALPRLASDVNEAIASNLAWLGERESPTRLSLFFVGSRDEMRPFTGTRSGGWSVVAEGTAFLVASDSVRPAIRHETMHLLSWRIWGVPGGTWMSEGVATLAAGGCREWSIAEVAAALYRDRQLVTIADMRRRFRTGGTQGAAYYISAASLVDFIDRTWGREKLRELWRSGGMGGAQAVLGVSPLTLERRWRLDVMRTKPPARWERMAREIDLFGCE